MQSSSLVDVALSLIFTDSSNPPFIIQHQVRINLEAYLNNKISYEDCEKNLILLVGNATALEKIKAILDIDETPIPSSGKQDTDTDSDTKRKKTRPWSSYEDQRLLAAIHKYGIQNWAIIAKFVGNDRTRSQAAQRWFRGLNPRISKDHWSKEEDMKLLQLVNLSGGRGWTHISNGMGNRSDVQCRYRYAQLQREMKEPKGQKGQISQSLSSGTIQYRPPPLTMGPQMIQTNTFMQQSNPMFFNANQFVPGIRQASSVMAMPTLVPQINQSNSLKTLPTFNMNKNQNSPAAVNQSNSLSRLPAIQHPVTSSTPSPEIPAPPDSEKPKLFDDFAEPYHDIIQWSEHEIGDDDVSFL